MACGCIILPSKRGAEQPKWMQLHLLTMARGHHWFFTVRVYCVQLLQKLKCIDEFCEHIYCRNKSVNNGDNHVFTQLAGNTENWCNWQDLAVIKVYWGMITKSLQVGTHVVKSYLLELRLLHSYTRIKSGKQQPQKVQHPPWELWCHWGVYWACCCKINSMIYKSHKDPKLAQMARPLPPSHRCSHTTN